jgi:quinol monooxygenase YgiN
VILITGAIRAAAASADQLMALGVEHSRRSRLEPGCIAHNISRDAEDPLRIVFVERWVDLDAVRVHFAVPAAGEFVRTVIALAEEPPTLELFEATPTSV